MFLEHPPAFLLFVIESVYFTFPVEITYYAMKEKKTHNLNHCIH